MTGKEVETVAVLLKRVRERADAVGDTVRGTSLDEVPHGDVVLDLAEGMKSLAAAIEMVTIEIADLRGTADPPEPVICPRCGAGQLFDATQYRPGQQRWYVECRACGHEAKGAWKPFGTVPR